ncbi:MAG TPA: U32 family peptidase [Xanthobacteraceae bacterium]|nr:U32 family peptidase [Xanthobacteraceae bacterium]
MTTEAKAPELTLGPVLFNWSAERWRDFYFRIADEAPIGTVYLGEAICSKRAPLFAPYCETVAARLEAAGKAVVLSTLAEVTVKQDRRLVEDICSAPARPIEANDASALLRLYGQPHHVGPFMNAYNERTLSVLARAGARNVCLPAEIPARAVAALCRAAAPLGVEIEVQVFGRVSLALSARCYHARAHGRTKDSCQFVCENDPDGMVLTTLEGAPFLAVNGIQTMSYPFLNLLGALSDLRAMGVARFRLSPQTCDMVEVALLFRRVLDRRIEADEAMNRLSALLPGTPFANGFYHGKPGHLWHSAPSE